MHQQNNLADFIAVKRRSAARAAEAEILAQTDGPPCGAAAQRARLSLHARFDQQNRLFLAAEALERQLAA